MLSPGVQNNEETSPAYCSCHWVLNTAVCQCWIKYKDSMTCRHLKLFIVKVFKLVYKTSILV